MDSAPAKGRDESQDGGRLMDRMSASSNSDLPLPRALLVFAHPDDEVIAVGARLERFRNSRLICVTDGSPRDGLDARARGFASLQDYAAARRAELESALRLAGLVPQQFVRTLDLGASSPPISDQEAAWRLAEVALGLAAELRSFQPEAILTHPYEGGHPDHDACAFAAHAAVQLAGASCAIVEAPFYHAAESGIETGRFLPAQCEEVIRPLSAEEKRKKKERLACFRSQAETLRPFGLEEERYRLAPSYDFTRPPHPGVLFYENFPWGTTGAQFRQRAAAVLAELQIERPPSSGVQ
jgi:LmbE family N-acetylglucosaminyl deacetylase